MYRSARSCVLSFDLFGESMRATDSDKWRKYIEDRDRTIYSAIRKDRSPMTRCGGCAYIRYVQLGPSQRVIYWLLNAPTRPPAKRVLIFLAYLKYSHGVQYTCESISLMYRSAGGPLGPRTHTGKRAKRFLIDIDNNYYSCHAAPDLP